MNQSSTARRSILMERILTVLTHAWQSVKNIARDFLTSYVASYSNNGQTINIFPIIP